MKKIILLFMFALISITIFGNTNADTIKIDDSKIEKIIEHETVNTKGNPTTKYYFIYNRELIPTSKSTVDKYNLAKKYNAKVNLVLIIRNRSRFVKAI